MDGTGVIKKALQQIVSGRQLGFEQALELALLGNSLPTALFQAADEVRRHFHHKALDLCSIVNAKSGRCSEDCKFCGQSSHYQTAVANYDVIAGEKAIALAKENEAHGVKRFSLVTAGRTVTDDHLEEFSAIYHGLREKTTLSLCASMGFLTKEKARKIKKMGVTRYHCNLEASKSFFPHVCTTHTWDEKVATIKIAQESGMEVCSGGIIGMGESLGQRLELAFELRELGVTSIPLNILTPIKDTPFAHLSPLTVDEVLICVAMFRLVNPLAVIRLAGGRNLLGSEQHKCFTSGANGAIVGNYLTTIGNNLTEDIAMFRSLGFYLADNIQGR
ncbi:MAG: biotin synthase BioB [Desulforhopalus sp.]|nr:biotin synthase BioB [Desulforhopalus sp.]